MNKEKNVKGQVYFVGTMIMNIVIILSLMLPQLVLAKSNENAIMGVDSEDPGGDALHPADDSHASLVVCVASKYNSVTDEFNIRFIYSANDGVNWQGYEWVSASSNQQDYPDVRIMLEGSENRILIIAVWQERIDANSPWQIKACTKYYSPSENWGSVIDISENEDLNDNIYPKIDTLRTGEGYGQNYHHYWNIVWQRMDDCYNWEIKMYTSYYTDGGPTIQINTIISGSPGSYRHPAVACTYISGGDCEVHIVYDAYLSSMNYVQVQSGWVSSNATYTRYNVGPYDLDNDSNDSEIGYPDITCSGPGGGPGHPNVQTGQGTVWIVWHHADENNEVKYAYSDDSLNSSPTVYTINTTNGPSTSAILRCVAIAMLEDSTLPVSIVWTDDSDIYFVTSGNWNVTEQWTSTEETDLHVDVSVISIDPTYSHVVWQRDDKTVFYARDP
ncbi:MAG: hypothetical protein JW939_09385 [Candidatus Thermoplasmatota archaeon]|nr:hypothetical protein [Candidatus Thermoplasmatota archaeon]